jgi:hypothetical protein
MKKLKLRNLLVIVLFVICGCDDGEDGIDGFNSIISTEIELAGTNCEAGGIKINYGKDINRNEVLENSEIENSEYICNGQNGNLELDNLTRIELGSPNVTSCGIDWFISEFETFHYPDFDKTDYSNVTSILFVPSIVSFEASNTVTVELYNMTDNVSISNSQIDHSGTFAFKYSENIFEYLPDYPITLGIRMKNSQVSSCGSLGIRSYLYILRE